MAPKTTEWDSPAYCETAADVAEHLAACMDEGGDDPSFVAHALGLVARTRSMAQFASDTGMTREGP